MRRVLSAFLMLAACGDGDAARRLADAPPAVDAAVDAAPQPVTLRVARNGKPVVGVHTYFLNPDSTVVKTVDTDAAGLASALMPLGGSVTAIDPFPPLEVPTLTVQPNNNELRTFAAVKAGDRLVLTQDDPPTSTTFTLQTTAAPNATAYRVLTTCGEGDLSPGGGAGGSGSPDPGGVLSFTGCGPMIDLAVVAQNFNNEGNPVLGALYKAGVAIAENATVTLPESDKYVAAVDRTFHFANLPDASMGLIHWLVTSRGKLRAFDGSPFDGLVATEPVVAGAASIVDTSVSLGVAEHHVVDWGALAATYTLDLNNVLLPNLRGFPVFDAATNRVTYTEAAGATPDVSLTAVSFSRVESRSWRWVISAPYAAGQVSFPTLPTDVYDWKPTVDDSIFVEGLVNAKVPGGYDAVRPFAVNLAVPQGRVQGRGLLDDASRLTAGTAGRAVVVQVVNQLGEARRRTPPRAAIRSSRSPSTSRAR